MNFSSIYDHRSSFSISIHIGILTKVSVRHFTYTSQILADGNVSQKNKKFCLGFLQFLSYLLRPLIVAEQIWPVRNRNRIKSILLYERFIILRYGSLLIAIQSGLGKAVAKPCIITGKSEWLQNILIQYSCRRTVKILICRYKPAKFLRNPDPVNYAHCFFLISIPEDLRFTCNSKCIADSLSILFPSCMHSTCIYSEDKHLLRRLILLDQSVNIFAKRILVFHKSAPSLSSGYHIILRPL